MLTEKKIAKIINTLNITESTLKTWLSRYRKEFAANGIAKYEKKGRRYFVIDICLEKLKNYIEKTSTNPKK